MKKEMKLNMRELAHYFMGAYLLLGGLVLFMNITNDNLLLTSVLWFFWYIIIDQMLHVIIMNKKISIFK